VSYFTKLLEKTNEFKVSLNETAKTTKGAASLMAEFKAQFGECALNLTYAIANLARVRAIRVRDTS